MIYDKASLVQIPSGYKSGTLYSVVPNTADGDFTVTGDPEGEATRVNKDGLIESVAADVPRLNYNFIDGVVQDCPALLLEPSRTNLQVRSEEFDNAAWTKSNCTVSANQTTSPDGTTTADKIIENSGSGSKKVYDSITTSSGTVYTWSVFLKADTRSKARLNIFGSYAEFDVANQTLLTQSGITSYKIEDYGNGWGRFSITETANATSTLTYVYLLDDAGNVSYTGDGVSGLFVWGAQLEAGSYPTSYIKNVDTSAGVTRTVDYASGAGNSDTFNDSEGTLFIDAAALGNDGTYRVLNISDGTLSNRVLIQLGNNNNQIRVDLVSSGVTQTSLSTTSYTFTDFNKIAFKYKGDDTALFINGTQVGTTQTGKTMPTGLDRIDFTNGNLGSTFYFRAKLKQLMYFNEALSDSELEEITSYTSFNKMAKALLYTIE